MFPVAFTLNRLGQHYDIDPADPAKWSTLVKRSWFWDYAFLFSNYHLEHHYFPGVPFYNLDAATAKGGDVPDGIEPLPRDIFTSDDFYVDRERTPRASAGSCCTNSRTCGRVSIASASSTTNRSVSPRDFLSTFIASCS